jgi:hypothetical protein
MADALPHVLIGETVTTSPGHALAIGAGDDVHQLRDLLALIGAVAGDDRVLDAMGDVIAQDLLLGAPQRGAHRRDLRDDVDAVAVVLDHAGEAADLPLDPVEPLETGRLDILAHAPYIPLPGTSFKPTEAR